MGLRASLYTNWSRGTKETKKSEKQESGIFNDLDGSFSYLFVYSLIHSGLRGLPLLLWSIYLRRIQQVAKVGLQL